LQPSVYVIYFRLKLHQSPLMHGPDVTGANTFSKKMQLLLR